MSLTEIAFYFLSFLAIFSGLAVILSRNPVHSVLYLIVTFFSIAGHYFLMNAQFLAAVHIIVYAGAIMVLFLFVLMLLNLNKDAEPKTPTIIWIISTVAGGVLFLVLVAALKDIVLVSQKDDFAPISNIGLVENLGNTLFTKFVVPFEISSILFISAMVGAILLAKRDKPTID